MRNSLIEPWKYGSAYWDLPSQLFMVLPNWEGNRVVLCPTWTPFTYKVARLPVLLIVSATCTCVPVGNAAEAFVISSPGLPLVVMA